MLHPRVPLPGDWATGGCPLVAPAPRGSPGDIPRDPVCPSRQMAASLVSTINPAGGDGRRREGNRVKPAAVPALRPVETRALGVKQRVPLLQPVGSQGTRAQSSNNKRKVRFLPQQRREESARASAGLAEPLPSLARGQEWAAPPARSQPHGQLPEALPLPTQSTSTQNSRSGFSLATVLTSPITAIFPPSQGFQLSRSGSKQSGAGRSGAQLQNTGMPAGS